MKMTLGNPILPQIADRGREIFRPAPMPSQLLTPPVKTQPVSLHWGAPALDPGNDSRGFWKLWMLLGDPKWTSLTLPPTESESPPKVRYKSLHVQKC